MQGIILTKKETSLIDMAVRSLGHSFPYFPLVSNPGYQMAALRFVIYSNERQSSSTAQANARQHKIILGKLIENYPDVSLDYVLQRDISVFTRDQRISRLLNGYRKQLNNGGSGSWTIRQHEGVINGLYNVYEGGSVLFCAPRAQVISLLTAYTEQERAAGVAKPIDPNVRKTVRAALADEILQSPTTSDQRKQAARDSQGTCYMCTAPKPRQIKCTVCGYIPRSGAR